MKHSELQDLFVTYCDAKLDAARSNLVLDVWRKNNPYPEAIIGSDLQRVLLNGRMNRHNHERQVLKEELYVLDRLRHEAHDNLFCAIRAEGGKWCLKFKGRKFLVYLAGSSGDLKIERA